MSGDNVDDLEEIPDFVFSLKNLKTMLVLYI